MASSLRQSGARQTLQQFYEQLDRRWDDAESLLLSLNVPAPVSVRIKTAGPAHRERARYHHELGFIKHYGQWGICYGLRSVEDPDDCLWTAIRRCSVEQRVEAARCFPELRDQVLDAADAYALEVEQAVRSLGSALELDCVDAEHAPSAIADATSMDDATTDDYEADQPDETTTLGMTDEPAAATDVDTQDVPEPVQETLTAPEPPPALARWEAEGGQVPAYERRAA